MGRAPCCSKLDLQRGAWTAREDRLLINYIQSNGEGRWRSLPQKAGLLRCGKSCRLRWMNYLRPDIKRGNITSDEDDLIIRLHSLLGNRWSLIAGRLPGRTDNEIKNYWNSHLSKRIKHTSTTKDKCLVSSSDQPTNKIKKGNNYQEPATPNGETNKKMNKIYIPKAVRVSSAVSFTRTQSFNSNMGSGSSNHLPWSWSDLEGEALPSINNYYKDDYVYGYVSSSQTYMPMTNDDKMLDGIFEEYERLLKKDNIAHLDSFIDSLLA